MSQFMTSECDLDMTYIVFVRFHTETNIIFTEPELQQLMSAYQRDF